MPNVLLVMSDSHNPFISSVYGHPFVKTPNMERLASMGTVYENAYCASPLCVPTRSAFMTGRYVHEIEVFNNCWVFESSYTTYGSVLREQGVHTAYIGGGTRLFCDAEDLGFSESLMTIKRKVGTGTGFVRRTIQPKSTGPLKLTYGPKKTAWDQDKARVDLAVQWLTETAPKITSPWTLTVGLTVPHAPLYARPELWAMYNGYGDLPTYGIEEESAKHPYAQDLRTYHRTGEFSEEQIRGLRQGYYACVSYMDQELGRLIDVLEESGQMHDTVVIYTSDHGEMLGKFGLWWKSTLHEDSVRIPLLVAGPGFEAGHKVETLVEQLDIQASIFRSVEKERPTSWQGIPLQDIPTHDNARVAFSEYHASGVRSGAFMLRRGDWKLLYNIDAPHQLFNLHADPDELRNRYADMPDVVGELELELRQICDPDVVNARAFARENEQYEAVLALRESIT